MTVEAEPGNGGTDGAPPRDFAALRALVMMRSGTLPRRLTQVASYALDNPDEIAFGTAASIAAKAQVQPSTLVRFSQAMGYQGFSDLQTVFRARLRESVLSYDERLGLIQEHQAGASRSGPLLEGFAGAAERSLATLRGRVRPEELDQAAALLAEASTIYLIGLRRSFAVAAYLAYGMGKLGIRHILVDGMGGLGLEQLGGIGPGDAAIAVSFTPYARETVAFAQAAKAGGARVVAISDSAFSPLSALADLQFDLAEADFEGFRSMVATMTLAITLTTAVASIRSSR